MAFTPIHVEAGETVLYTCAHFQPKKKRRQEEGVLTRYCKVIKYLLSTYPTDEVIAQTNAEITLSRELPNMKPVEYGPSLWLKALKLCSINHKKKLEGKIVEGLHESLFYRMHVYLGSHETAM